jgi:glycosyltransferase involved in cell wall biosynthesis
VKLSIVVPAYNEEALLPRTLAHLRAGMSALAERGWAAELVVCDNNSADRTAAIAREAGARVVFEPVNQISRARNRGARDARGEWLLFVDADCAPSPALFRAMADAIARGECIGGGARVELPASRAAVRVWVTLWNAFSRATSWAAGAFLFCEAHAFRAAGGFSEALYAAEEIDLSRRLKKMARRRGLRFVILSEPLATSARKAELYRWWEHARFFAGVALSGGRALRRRERCAIWYDGRR